MLTQPMEQEVPTTQQQTVPIGMEMQTTTNNLETDLTMTGEMTGIVTTTETNRTSSNTKMKALNP